MSRRASAFSPSCRVAVSRRSCRLRLLPAPCLTGKILAGRRNGLNQYILNTKIHLAVDAFGMPLRVIVTKGTTADCKMAKQLIDGFSADYLIADRGYDSNEIIDFSKSHGITPEIPPRKSRKSQRVCDEDLYKVRHLIENAFLKLKSWRGVATGMQKPHRRSEARSFSPVLSYG